MHFENDVNIKDDAEVAEINENDLFTIMHIQKLEIKVAQYEQEKLRLKKKNKKIKQIKLCWQNCNPETAQIIMFTIFEIELNVDAKFDWEKNDAVIDYKLAIHWKLFVNSFLISENDLEIMRKKCSTDLVFLEIIINKAIDQHLDDMKIDHEIVSHDYIASTAAYYN